jgi:hypothetical protein
MKAFSSVWFDDCLNKMLAHWFDLYGVCPCNSIVKTFKKRKNMLKINRTWKRKKIENT